jgi:excisionase family DNA binding protein
MIHAEDILTLDQVCKVFQVRKGWVYRQTREKTIPFHRMGKYLRFYRPELEKWFERQKVKPAA